MGHRGREIQPLNEALLRETARRLQSMEVEAVAVCLHHSCANPAHEERVREIFMEEYPDAFGGLAPLIVADVAALFGIRNAVVPSQSSCLSAIGLAEAELRNEYSSACLVRLTEESGEGLTEKFEGSLREAESDLNLEKVPEDERLFSRSVDIR